MRLDRFNKGRWALFLIAVAGCSGDGAVEQLAQQCGLACPAASEGILVGNGAISGVANVDAFFTSVIAVRNASLDVSGSVRAELEALALAFGVTAEGKATAQLAAEVKAAIQADITANVQGGLQVKYEPVRCEADVELAVQAKADCEAQVMPPKVEIDCRGTCDVSASAAAQCSASGTLTCQGSPPNLACSGTCQGSCQLTTAASCTGVCNGSCTGTCSVCAGGACQGSGTITNCAGDCSGTCQGECKLEAGGSCSGQCEGSCTYTPAMAMCDAGFQARCTAKAEASIKCEGKCEGEVTPGSAKVECEASVQARAKANVVCKPPQLQVDYQFKASLTVEAQAVFRAKVNALKVHFAGMLATTKRLNGIADASADLTVAANGAVKAAFEEADGNGSVKAQVGLLCALGELPKVGTVLGSVKTELQASFEAVGTVGESVGVSQDGLQKL